MNDEQFEIYDEYLRRFPHTLSVVCMDVDNVALMTPIVEQMKVALETNKPLTDSIFNLPKGADI